jgi:pimeloyl-ACP methyl ester carboxylesterase
MKSRSLVLAAALAGLSSLAPSTCNPPSGLVLQAFFTRPGYVEAHTPGSGDPAEIAPTAAVTSLLGADVDLNRVHYVRSRWDNGTGTPPRVIVILIPGFLGGATTFDPLARDLVAKFNGNLEVWAVDRRPNQLEDRLGATFALMGATQPACTVSPPLPSCSIFVGAQFYAPDLDAAPTGDFPGPGDLDLNLNGVFDPQGQLQDSFGVTRGPLLLAQNDARFMAYWGLDTYFRDWKLLIEDARAVVGPSGLVLLGGHSQGTTWASTFAAYDFDPDPAHVTAGYSLIDGLILLEGGGVGAGSATKPTYAQYQATVASLDDVGGPEVFLANFSGIPLQSLGTSGEVSAIAGLFQPNEPALIQRTPTFGTGIVGTLLSAPSTNRALGGLFLDDDFSPIGAFRASLGFSDNGANTLVTTLPGFAPFYLASPATGGGLRTWKEFDDPTLPSCPPNTFNVSPGCALLDNGPPSDPLNPAAPPRNNGREVETTSLTDFFLTQVGKGNGFEWYFASGRPNLDFGYGRDSSGLVAQALAVDPSNEGPLVVTQNAAMNVPVLAIGGSNGLAPEAKSFANYLGSIATPAADKRVVIVEGYAHLDVINARNNKALPPIVDFTNELLQRKLLSSF